MEQFSKLPFFMVGCAWSGIAVMKKVLLRHPKLYSTEATHFYRWTEPFGSKAFTRGYLHSQMLKANWLRDGFSEDQIQEIFANAETRMGISRQYSKKFLRNHKTEASRWFDASPQNVYGLLLIKAHFPKSKIVHVHGNPLEIVASLMHSPSASSVGLVAAVNHWLETMQIISVFKEVKRNNLIEIKYDDFLHKPAELIEELLTKLNEDVSVFDFSKLRAIDKSHEEIPQDLLLDRRSRKGYASLLSSEEVRYILKHCEGFMQEYGYDIPKLEAKSKPSGQQADYHQASVSIQESLGQTPN